MPPEPLTDAPADLAAISPPLASSSPFANRSPVDGAPLPEVRATAAEDVPGVVARARGAQAAWAARPLEERARALLKVKERILDRAELVARQVRAEVGKPEEEALVGEVLPSADVVDFWVRSAEDLLEPVEVELDPLAYGGKRGTIYREARGVIALVTPYNFPFALPLRTLIPALLAGNAVVFKPSEVTPRSGMLVSGLFEGLLPDGVLEIVQGGGDVGGALVSADVDLVVFTGSVRTGKKVAHACAERLVPCALELGGKDAAIVLADANLDRAAAGVVWGAMMNAGQNCASIERVYVERSVATPFLEKCGAVVRSLRPGVDYGPLATEAQRTVVQRHVEDARRLGGEVIAGGGEDGSGVFPPTLVTVPSDDTELMREETFGPVLPVAIVENADEAVARANESRFGLTASVWTKDLRRGEALARRLRAGVVTVNNHAFTGAIPAAPWSGRGESGYGITNSPLALDALTRPRFVLLDKGKGGRELWWFPYTPALRAVALAMATARNGGKGIFARVAGVFALLGAMMRRRRER
jgi:acyl-CoA reductase-like NAD-dependent aldehyde dehydrogenase